MNYNTLLVIVCVYVESLHRYAFDNLYEQKYKLKKRDKIFLSYYKFLCLLFPYFRVYLKQWKPVLVHAYNQKRLSLFKQLAFFRVRNVNTDRYSNPAY